MPTAVGTAQSGREASLIRDVTGLHSSGANGMRNNTLYHIFSSRTKGVLKLDKLINQVVIPVNLRGNILAEYHDSLVGGGHQGFDRTYYAIKAKYYWKGMYADVDKYVRQCKECQYAKRKFHGQPAPLHHLAVAAVFQRWHMDFLGPLKKKADGESSIYFCL